MLQLLRLVSGDREPANCSRVILRASVGFGGTGALQAHTSSTTPLGLPFECKSIGTARSLLVCARDSHFCSFCALPWLPIVCLVLGQLRSISARGGFGCAG